MQSSGPLPRAALGAAAGGGAAGGIESLPLSPDVTGYLGGGASNGGRPGRRASGHGLSGTLAHLVVGARHGSPLSQSNASLPLVTATGAAAAAAGVLGLGPGRPSASAQEALVVVGPTWPVGEITPIEDEAVGGMGAAAAVSSGSAPGALPRGPARVAPVVPPSPFDAVAAALSQRGAGASRASREFSRQQQAAAAQHARPRFPPPELSVDGHDGPQSAGRGSTALGGAGSSAGAAASQQHTTRSGAGASSSTPAVAGSPPNHDLQLFSRASASTPMGKPPLPGSTSASSRHGSFTDGATRSHTPPRSSPPLAADGVSSDAAPGRRRLSGEHRASGGAAAPPAASGCASSSLPLLKSRLSNSAADTGKVRDAMGWDATSTALSVQRIHSIVVSLDSCPQTRGQGTKRAAARLADEHDEEDASYTVEEVLNHVSPTTPSGRTSRAGSGRSRTSQPRSRDSRGSGSSSGRSSTHLGRRTPPSVPAGTSLSLASGSVPDADMPSSPLSPAASHSEVPQRREPSPAGGSAQPPPPQRPGPWTASAAGSSAATAAPAAPSNTRPAATAAALGGGSSTRLVQALAAAASTAPLLPEGHPQAPASYAVKAHSLAATVTRVAASQHAGMHQLPATTHLAPTTGGSSKSDGDAYRRAAPVSAPALGPSVSPAPTSSPQPSRPPAAIPALQHTQPQAPHAAPGAHLLPHTPRGSGETGGTAAAATAAAATAIGTGAYTSQQCLVLTSVALKPTGPAAARSSRGSKAAASLECYLATLHDALAMQQQRHLLAQLAAADAGGGGGGGNGVAASQGGAAQAPDEARSSSEDGARMSTVLASASHALRRQMPSLFGGAGGGGGGSGRWLASSPGRVTQAGGAPEALARSGRSSRASGARLAPRGSGLRGGRHSSSTGAATSRATTSASEGAAGCDEGGGPRRRQRPSNGTTAQEEEEEDEEEEEAASASNAFAASGRVLRASSSRWMGRLRSKNGQGDDEDDEEEDEEDGETRQEQDEEEQEVEEEGYDVFDSRAGVGLGLSPAPQRRRHRDAAADVEEEEQGDEGHEGELGAPPQLLRLRPGARPAPPHGTGVPIAHSVSSPTLPSPRSAAAGNAEGFFACPPPPVMSSSGSPKPPYPSGDASPGSPLRSIRHAAGDVAPHYSPTKSRAAAAPAPTAAASNGQPGTKVRRSSVSFAGPEGAEPAGGGAAAQLPAPASHLAGIWPAHLTRSATSPETCDSAARPWPYGGATGRHATGLYASHPHDAAAGGGADAWPMQLPPGDGSGGGSRFAPPPPAAVAGVSGPYYNRSQSATLTNRTSAHTTNSSASGVGPLSWMRSFFGGSHNGTSGPPSALSGGQQQQPGSISPPGASQNGAATQGGGGGGAVASLVFRQLKRLVRGDSVPELERQSHRLARDGGGGSSDGRGHGVGGRSSAAARSSAVGAGAGGWGRSSAAARLKREEELDGLQVR